MNSVQNPVDEIRALSDLIKSSIDKIEESCLSRGQIYPSANDPFTPQSEAARMAPDVQEYGSIVVAAAAQLIAATRPPPLGLATHALKFHVSSCIRVVINLHVAEILREGGPLGVHVHDIAAPTKVDPTKLARVLRLLATNHIFLEVAPDVFSHNRLSSLLDTGKSVTSILADGDAKYDNTLGIAALFDHFGDEAVKSSGYITETLIDPKTARSGEPNQTAFNRAFKTDLPMFHWYDLEENAFRRRRFGIGFDWKALPQGSLIVDVGGGIGSQTHALAKAFDHLSFVVQDRDAVIEEAAKFWNEKYPEAVKLGRVKLQAHDFFEPQPISGPSVFFMRMIMHDWSNDYCLKILSHLRSAAAPSTQLVIIDNIASYACPDTTSAQQTPGASTRLPPAPLLANKGEANVLAYLGDIQMLNLNNGSERTIAQFSELLRKSGWKLVRVAQGDGFEGENSKLIGVPA
ncbi:hypothetical protein EW026_g6076 [Hermanssonia centrifuga]|uniref:Uncharacterized protein n=1 Tax=Hermanssonia centrifuga TaxID=98765 RepID=A0A4S4KC43_9APHY|nr:hypothetical protein EW026_g6076 [Hermanssonia centrifuga]